MPKGMERWFVTAKWLRGHKDQVIEITAAPFVATGGAGAVMTALMPMTRDKAFRLARRILFLGLVVLPLGLTEIYMVAEPIWEAAGIATIAQAEAAQVSAAATEVEARQEQERQQ